VSILRDGEVFISVASIVLDRNMKCCSAGLGGNGNVARGSCSLAGMLTRLRGDGGAHAQIIFQINALMEVRWDVYVVGLERRRLLGLSLEAFEDSRKGFLLVADECDESVKFHR